MKNYKAKYLIKVDDLDNAIEFINSLEVVASTLRHKDSLEIFLREFKEMTCKG